MMVMADPSSAERVWMLPLTWIDGGELVLEEGV